MSLKRTKKTLTLLTLFFFFTSSFSYSAPPEYLNNLQEPFGSFLEDLPRELGVVKSLNFSGFFDNSGTHPFVIHIQDAHANPEAQLRIKEILTWLRQTSKLPFQIGMEGAVGPIHPEYLEFFSDFPEANDTFVRDLHQKGELTGAEWFAWEQYKEGKPSPVPVSGVETAELYRENLKNFRDLLFRRGEITAALEPFRAALEVAKTNRLSPDLRAFVREKEKSREVFIPYLTRSAKKVLDIDLKSSIEQLRFPNLTRLVYVQEMESRLDEKIAKAEWEKIKSELARYPEAKKQIDPLDVYWREPEADRSRLRSIFEALFQTPGFSEKFSFEPYPHYSDWARHAMLSAEVEVSALFAEIDRVSQAVENRLAVTETDKRILALQADFTLFEKLNLLELTRDEFSRIKERKNSFAPLEMAKRFKELSATGKPGFSFPRNNPLLGVFDAATRFYETTEKRDAALLENALGLVSQNPKESSFVVLITGGFHTDGLTHLMAQRSVSHAVIAPALTRIGEENLYHRVLRRENADLSAYFKNPPLNKQEALFFKGLIEKAMPELAKKKLTSTELVQRAHEVLNRHPLFKNLEASLFPGEKEPFVRLTVRKDPVPASSQAVAEVANTSDRDVYSHLAAESLPLSFTETPMDLLPAGERFEVRRVETLAARAQKGIAVESGPITSERLAALGLRQIRNIVERGALGALADTPQLVGSWTGPRLEMRSNGVSDEDRGLIETLDLHFQLLAKAPAHSEEQRAALFNIRKFALDNREKIPVIIAVLDKKTPKDLVQMAVRTIKAKNIGVLSSQGSANASAVMLGNAGHVVTALDINDGPSHLEKLVSENEIIYLDYDIQPDLTYEQYVKKLEGFAMDLGNALKILRQSGDRSRRVFVIRSMVGRDESNRIYDKIQWHTEPPEKNPRDYTNFDVVYQPDFTYQEEQGAVSEPYVVFGLRDSNMEAENAETKRILEGVYDLDTLKNVEIEYTDIRSAEESKDALLIYLGLKLAHMNDLASISERFGADLSVVALGAGIDPRILQLFTNPSHGFGGRLLLLLKWIRSERLHRAVQARTAGKGEQEVLRQRDEIVRQLQRAIDEMDERVLNPTKDGKDILHILQEVPEGLHMLLWIETILRINEKTQAMFFEKIERQYQNFNQESLRGKKIAFLGIGHNRKSENVTESQAIKQIIRFVKEKGVREFYVTDSKERLAAFRQWLEAMRKTDDDFNHIKFHGVDDEEDLDVYRAIEQSHAAIIATDSHPDIKNLDMTRVVQALNKVHETREGEPAPPLPGRPLFDGVNIFGLRANGEINHSLQSVRDAGINYVSLGRPNIGPRADKSKEGYYLRDSRLFKSAKEFPVKEFKKKKIAVIGAGYVGLVTGWLFAHLGHDVTVSDIDAKRVEGLNNKKFTHLIYERGLKEALRKVIRQGLFRAALNGDEGEARASGDRTIEENDILYLALPTNQQDDGQIDLTHILKVTNQIGAVIKRTGQFKTIVIKSTVTAETFEKIDQELAKIGLAAGRNYALVSNPEFLREGEALNDVLNPSITVAGIYAAMPSDVRERVGQEMMEVYYPSIRDHSHAFLLTDTATATDIKYTINSLLPASISFINTLAKSLEKEEIDYYEIKKRLTRYPSVGPKAFVEPCPGFAGSCFPKDERALGQLSKRRAGHTLLIPQITDAVNEHAKMSVVGPLIEALSDYPKAEEPLAGKTIAMLGVAFKKETDDVRETQAARALYELLMRKPKQVRIHDFSFTRIYRKRGAPPANVIQDRFLLELYKIFKKEGVFPDVSPPEVLHLNDQEMAHFQMNQFLIFFKEKYLDTERVVFVNSLRRAFRPNQAKGWDAVDGVIIITDSPEYANLNLDDLTVNGKRPFIMDGRNLIHKKGRTREFRDRGLGYAGIGVRGFARRAEHRVWADEGRLAWIFASDDPTEKFAVDFASVRFTRPADVPLEQVEGRFPGLRNARSVAEKLAADFYDPSLLNAASEGAVFHFLQKVLVAGKTQDPTLRRALEIAREALGEYAWLLDQKETAPIHIAEPSSLAPLQNPASLFLALAGPRDQATLIAGDGDSTVLRDRLRQWRLSAKVKIIGTDGASTDPKITLRAMRKLMTRGLEQRLGTFHPERTFLEDLSAQGIDRFLLARPLDQDTVFLITAFLLRHQIADRDIINLHEWMNEKGIDENDLVSHVAEMVKAVSLFLTQA